MIERELFYFKICENKWLIFNWIVSGIYQYLEAFNFVDILIWIVWKITSFYI